MKNELSAFVDGEAEVHEICGLLAAMRTDADLRQSMSLYRLIGDSMRNEGSLDRDLLPGVMQALAEGPVVLAPKIRQKAATRPLLALAASLAGVAVVGWLAIAPRLPEPSLIARTELAAPVRVEPVTLARVRSISPQVSGGNMQEYLVAHQASVSSIQLSSAAGHIRTVSAVGGQ